MSIAQLIRDMTAAGAPAEAIAIAVEAIEAGQAQIEARRATDRERKRRQRDASRDSHGTVTGQSETVTPDPSLSLPPNEINSNPPAHTHPNTQPRARKGHRLPEDWAPKPLPTDLGLAVSAWPCGAMERELARFRDWAASASGPVAIKNNWDAAWRNWLRKAEDEGRYGRKNGNGQRDEPDRRDGVAKALDRRLGRGEPAGEVGRPDPDGAGGHRGLPAPRALAVQ